MPHHELKISARPAFVYWPCVHWTAMMWASQFWGLMHYLYSRACPSYRQTMQPTKEPSK